MTADNPPPPSPRYKLFAALILAVMTAAVLIALSRSGWLPEAQDRVIYDWRSYYLTEPAAQQRDDIALVLIDEDSLTGYNCLSPVDRGLVAELVREIDRAGAKVIGLDLIIDRPNKNTEALLTAIRETKNAEVVQAAVTGANVRPHEFAFQEDFVKQAGTIPGHLYFASERNRLTLGGRVIRFRMGEGLGDPPRPSFAWALAEAGGHRFAEPPSSYIAWQRPPVGAADLFTTFKVRPHRDQNGQRSGTPLSPRALSSLKDKIVLIGGAFTDRDRHLTPWTVASGERVPGVQVHAQIVAHLIDERWIYEPETWWEFPLLVVIFCLGFYAAQHWKLSGSGLITSAVAFASLILLGIALYWSMRVILPSATIVLAWSAGLFFGSISDSVLRRVGRQRS